MISRENLEWLRSRGVQPTIYDCHDEECMFTSYGKNGKLTRMNEILIPVSATGATKRLMQCPKCKTIRMVDL